ncbi:tryptophan synthase beta subunit-like PLP-dependent enzyme [Daldinia vernicosa]|uniref:tryptophan synthase beta subunit-like PLP-dependent enzyme n=1 Tax=Daldinia vernicosa TaxID=114800 RepID=UPI0020084FF7|nr:tryptophan synthase beta subunit-like PLP-dependent enzyme [Daldinia vernicosa]KAI0851612.1 tryptophan synthase beta subunit-like PLP-dependent enzyme [Daldinia vernicosa]
MGSCNPELQKLFIETPCIPSIALSRVAGCNIFLKLENLQPSGSFKSRAVGNMMYQAMLAKPAGGDVHFYCSSGGNAGLACATAAATLAQPCTIVVPTTTSQYMIEKIRLLGAQVHQVGPNWALADSHLRTALLARDPTGIYVPPFDHPDIWAGTSTIVDELAAQLGVPRVDGIACSCGGGGLLNGIMAGVRKHYTDVGVKEPTVLAVETVGADSLNASVKAGALVTLAGITSIATSLGAPRVSERTFRWSQEAAGHLKSLVVTDAEAVMGAVRFADDARMLVEVACGATLATVYNGDLRRVVGGEGEEGISDEEWSRKNVVVIVCGGVNVTLEMLRSYGEKYGVK